MSHQTTEKQNLVGLVSLMKSVQMVSDTMDYPVWNWLSVGSEMFGQNLCFENPQAGNKWIQIHF